MQDDFAVIVGISDYPGPSPRSLEGPVNDAIAFRDWAVRADGGAVPDDPDHLKLITSADFPAAGGAPQGHPSRDDVIRRFDEIMDYLDTQDICGRRLYIFFAGHGCSPTDAKSLRNAALLMANARLPNRPYNIAGNLVADYFRTAAYFEEVVLFMDCCRDEMSNAVLDPLWSPVAEPGESRLVTAYAADWGRKSREHDYDGTKRGIFSYSLVEVLKQGRIGGNLLKASLPAHIDFVSDKPVRQQAQIEGDLDEMVFSEGATPAKSDVTIDIRGNGEAAEILAEDPNSDDLVPVEQFNLGNQPWRGQLEPRNYFLFSQEKQLRKRFNVLAGVPKVLNGDGSG